MNINYEDRTVSSYLTEKIRQHDDAAGITVTSLPGAAACITQLAKEKGNVDFNTLYTAVANTWVNTSSREYAAYAAMSDVHSNGKLRVNRVLVNIDEFYEAFDIKEGDGMYVAPEERITVW